MIQGRFAGQRALVVTPFLPLPADAGQRKRVQQFHELLRAQGCHITLLHYAVEQPFVWAHHDGIDRAVQEMMDEVITVQAGPSFGQPPLANGAHRLDEWWDTNLSDTVQRLFAKRWFDIVVVNNVWLTKVFDFTPPGTAKILESHDVFSERIEALRAIGQQPDFFICERSDEAFGWNRADVVVAISDAEQLTIAPHLGRATAIALPYAEEMQAPSRRDYVHPGKVVFGFFGSAHPFNVQGLKALIAELAQAARWSPIELVIAGEVGRALSPSELSMVKDLGYVQSPDDFYDNIDVFVSPLDFGSGLKIKVVEAISKGIPTLVTEHSAIGTHMVPQLVVKDVSSLARAMERIAQRRPDLGVLAEAVERSQTALATAIEDGTRRLVDSVNIKQKRSILRYAELSLPASDPRLWMVVGMLREIANPGPVALDMGDGAPEPRWLRYLHPRVQLVGPAPLAAKGYGDSRPRIPRERLQRSLSFQIVISNDAQYRLPGAALHLHDARWDAAAAPAHATRVIHADGIVRDGRGESKDGTFPSWSQSLTWDPILPPMSKKRGPAWIALAVPNPGSQAESALTELATLAATLPVRVFETGDAFVAGELFAQLRDDPPALVVELRWPGSESGTEAWCSLARIPYVATLSAREVLTVVKGPPAAPELVPATYWHEMLDRLFASQ